MSGPTDVAGVVAHYRQVTAMPGFREAIARSWLLEHATHIVSHVSDVAIGTDDQRAGQLRAAGEALLVAALMHQRAMQAARAWSAEPFLTTAVVAGLRLVDDAFELAVADPSRGRS